METYFDEYTDFSDARESKMDPKYDCINLTLDSYDDEEWFIRDDEESADLPSMPPIEGDEEKVKEGKGLKILTTSKPFTKLPVLFEQVKAVNT